MFIRFYPDPSDAASNKKYPEEAVHTKWEKSDSITHTNTHRTNQADLQPHLRGLRRPAVVMIVSEPMKDSI